MTTADLLTRLNSHDPFDFGALWSHVIRHVPGYDEAATRAAEPSWSGDVFVADGVTFRRVANVWTADR